MPLPFTRKQLVVPLWLSLAVLAGCATVPHPDATAQNVASAPASAPAEANQDGPLPNVELTDQLVMRFLVGDIALQRGEPTLAAQTWNDLAKRTHDPRIARRATEVSIGAGQLNLALDSAQLWIDSSPQALNPQQVMLSLLLRANRLEEAKPHLKALLEAKPQDVPSFMMQMHLLWDKNTDRAAAAKFTEEVTQPYLNLPEAHFARAVAYANTSRVSDALKELTAAESLRPAWEPAVLYRVQLMNDQPAQARIDYLKDAMRQNPDSAQIKTTLAREYVTNRQYKEARELYEEALRKQPDMLEALVGSGLVALEQRDLDTAYLRLSTAVVKSPRTTNNLRLYLGQIAEERGQTATALSWYQGVDGDMKDAAQQRMMRLYVKAGRPEDALALVRAQPSTSPQERVIRAQLEAQVWREAKEYNKAWDALSNELKKQPDSPDLLYDRSLVADLQHNLPAAEADLHRFLQLQPDSVMGLNALGYTLANRTDRLDEANGYLEKAIAKEPDNPVIQDSLGWLRYRQGRFDEAKDLLTKAFAAMPDAEIGAHLAAVLWRQGEKSDARKVLAAAQKLDPTNESVIEISKTVTQ
ncbi:tetratricopeptide repeat protein [Amantichitinum ursilacus]|uniref:Tetratricopeptide repeat protein n=1 Tax=Amantichitinum ursilacus TaxID=857265 RepID=A0A0N0GL09_9NEIS|nr:tetratricopeptide repeat protein [Amantichitinum ursilacus]KPC49345.1 tetratricopeptide repeat protein [Amantichitinum ursilacus]